VIASANTGHAAVWHLVDWLVEHRAPAIGYGPHPDVKPRRMYGRFEVTDNPGCSRTWPHLHPVEHGTVLYGTKLRS
jgi:hypothetical protein